MSKILNLKNFLSLSEYLKNRIDYLQGAGGAVFRTLVMKTSGGEE